MSTQLAKCERIHAEAQADQTTATAHSQTLSDRIADIRQRMSDITSRRLSGTANDRDAAEFAALQGDESALVKMLAAAQAAQAQAAAKTRQAIGALQQAQQEHAHGQAQARYEALHQKAKEIEAVFCRALGEVGRAGRDIGHYSFTESFKRSDCLHRALNLNVIPAQE